MLLESSLSYRSCARDDLLETFSREPGEQRSWCEYASAAWIEALCAFKSAVILVYDNDYNRCTNDDAAICERSPFVDTLTGRDRVERHSFLVEAGVRSHYDEQENSLFSLSSSLQRK